MEVGVTETPKNPQVIIRGGVAMKAHIGNFARNRGGGGACSEDRWLQIVLQPNRRVSWRHALAGYAQNMLSFAILWGCIRARIAKQNTTRCWVGSGRCINEFFAIICLKTLNWNTKLSLRIRNKLNNMLINIRLKM